jgi:hypothetical protein
MTERQGWFDDDSAACAIDDERAPFSCARAGCVEQPNCLGFFWAVDRHEIGARRGGIEITDQLVPRGNSFPAVDIGAVDREWKNADLTGLSGER